MKRNSRVFNSILNSISGILGYLVVMIATMVSRIIFARFLGEELLGLNSLYTSILQILQITELGIGTAMVVFLYEPVKKNDKLKISQLMDFYRKAYNIFAGFLLIVGLLVQFFLLPHMVKVRTINHFWVEIYFFIFLISVVCSYLFASYKSIFYAEQRNRVVFNVNAIQKTVVALMQIAVVTYFKSFLLYLILIIIGNLSENVVTALMVRKKYPYLRQKACKKISSKERKSIFSVVKPIFIVQLADKALGQTDSILINQFISIVTLGMYTNYNTIFNACIGLFTPMGSALTSSYGNLAVDASSSERYQAFRRSYSAIHLVALIICILFVAFIQDFIYICYGSKYVMSVTLAVLIGEYLYCYFVKSIYYSYQNALGLQRLDQKYVILQVIFNTLICIILAIYFGINGIILGTITSLIIFSFGFKGAIIYRQVFKMPVLPYYKRTLLDLAASTFLLIGVGKLSELFTAHTIGLFALKVLVFGSLGVVVPTLFFLIVDSDLRSIIGRILKK